MMRERRKIVSRAGMTLIELTVGIVVAGLVVGAGYAAFASAIDNRARAARAAQESARSVGIRRTLTQWLEGALPLLPTSSNTDPDAVSQLNVITRAPTPMGTPSSGIRLLIDNGSSGAGRGLVAMLRPDVGNDSMRVMLDPFARSMSIEYLVTGNGARHWRTQAYLVANSATGGSGGEELPIAIRLQIASDDSVVNAALAEPIVIPLNRVR